MESGSIYRPHRGRKGGDWVQHGITEWEAMHLRRVGRGKVKMILLLLFHWLP